MKYLSLFTVAVSLFLFSCNSANQNAKEDSATVAVEKVVTGKMKFNESVLPYNGGLLISNFGTDALEPLNQSGKGFILFYKDDSLQTIVPAKGNLHAPKGMYVKDDVLFVADVNKVAVYNLKDTAAAPVNIQFPADDVFVNDLAGDGKNLYVSVVNTGNIYKLDITDLSKVAQVKPEKFSNVVGANGLVIDGNTMYVASYPADGKTTDANVVYVIKDMNNPAPEKLITEAGQYDGLALSADKKLLYVGNWSPVGVEVIDMDTKAKTPLAMDSVKFAGVADFSLVGDSVLYIPDLVNSTLVIKSINK